MNQSITTYLKERFKNANEMAAHIGVSYPTAKKWMLNPELMPLKHYLSITGNRACELLPINGEGEE